MAFRRKSKKGFSIPSFPPKMAAPAWVCRSPRASSRNTAAPCNTAPRSITAPLSASSCRAWTRMNAVAQILLIEDDSGLAAALQRVLAEEGCVVSMESRGDAGLARAQADSFDVVITDLKLPGL